MMDDAVSGTQIRLADLCLELGQFLRRVRDEDEDKDLFTWFLAAGLKNRVAMCRELAIDPAPGTEDGSPR